MKKMRHDFGEPSWVTEIKEKINEIVDWINFQEECEMAGTTRE